MKSSWMALVLVGLAAPAGAQTWDQAKPVLKNSCFRCHAPKFVTEPRPAVSISVERKRRKMIAQAMAAFSMDEKFPFAIGDSPKNQMDKMRHMISAGKMPPNGHVKMGMGVALSKTDRKALMDWLQAPLK